MRHFALIAVLLTSGCAANHQYFRPAERQHGRTLAGETVALYPLIGPQGQFGEAKVWSRGSYRGRERQTIVQLSMELHNTSASALQVSPRDVQLETVQTDLGPATEVPTTLAHDVEVGPGALREVGFEFELPPGVAPGEVNGFVARWTVRNKDQAYTQRSPFVIEYRQRYYAPYPMYAYPYYACDPFDPYCPYGYGYRPPYYGPYLGPRYGGPIGRGPAERGAVIVHPRR